jgi:O-antigen/teichoic acid export membrane protein
MSPTKSEANAPAHGARFSLHVAWTVIARIVMIANSLLAGVIVAHWLGAEGVGKLAVINVSVMTLVQLGSLGLPSANTYFISKEPGHFRKAALNSLLFALLCGTLLAVGLAVVAQLRPAWFGFVSPELFRVAAISIPFQLLNLIGLNIFLAIGRIREFNLLDLAGQSFVLINALVVLVILRSNLGRLVFLNTAASVLVGVVVIALLVHLGNKSLANAGSWRTDVLLFRQMMEYGIKSHISILAGTLIFRADLLVVNLFRGAGEAGVYTIATQVAMMLMVLPGVIGTLLFPRVTAEQDATGETTCMVARYASFVMLLCTLVAIPLSLLLPFVYGTAFADSSTQLLILLPGVYLVGIQSVVVQHFNALGLPKSVPIFWLVTLAVNVALVFVLVPRFGARGAALGSTISYTLIAVLMISKFVATTGRSLFDVFVLRGTELKSLLNSANTKIQSAGVAK